MKYQNLKSFQKHLSSAAPHYLCHFYLVAVPDDFERSQILHCILSHLASQPIRFTGSDCDLREVLDSMQTWSLLGNSVIVLDEVEKLSKKNTQVLIENLEACAGFALFGARSKVKDFAVSIEKIGVVLDLTDEKPWDKEKRLIEELLERAGKTGKKLMPDAASLLLERTGIDLALLQSEIDKLICFVGERTVIAREDVLAITIANQTATFWQVAEEVIWEGKEFSHLEEGVFHGLTSALRHQLHLGLTLASLIEEKRPADEWGQFLPKLWPKVLEKRSSQASRLGSSYFQKGLEKLFEMELYSRSISTHYQALLDLFRAHLHGR